jgi:hypothetical protein
MLTNWTPTNPSPDEEDEADVKAAKDKAKKEKKEAEKLAAEKDRKEEEGPAAEGKQKKGAASPPLSPRDIKRYYRDSSDDESEAGRQAEMLGKLQGYDYNPQQTGGSVSTQQQQEGEGSEYPEEPLSEYGGGR